MDFNSTDLLQDYFQHEYQPLLLSFDNYWQDYRAPSNVTERSTF